MPSINPVTGEISILSVEDYNSFYMFFTYMRNKVLPKKTIFLIYDTNWLLSYYYKTSDEGKLLASSNKKYITPYELIFDYRKNKSDNWGFYTFDSDFILTHELDVVKDELLGIFKKKGLLYKGNNLCSRINNVIIENNKLKIEIQKASYYDQVATNLSLDYKLNDFLSESLNSKTLREWDIKQSKTKKNYLPRLTESKLANTIGIALGITTVNNKGEKIVLIRKRTKNVAVTQNSWALPFSFSLNIDKDICCIGKSGFIIDLIKADFRHEQAEELGTEPRFLDFENVRPLFLCRELCRGGKPQFFFQIDLEMKFEELKKIIKESSSSKKEFKGKIVGITLNNALKYIKSFSHELAAFIVANK